LHLLVSEIHRLLELLRIKHPPLDVANIHSITQRGCPALAAASQPLVGEAMGDP